VQAFWDIRVGQGWKPDHGSELFPAGYPGRIRFKARDELRQRRHACREIDPSSGNGILGSSPRAMTRTKNVTSAAVSSAGPGVIAPLWKPGRLQWKPAKQGHCQLGNNPSRLHCGLNDTDGSGLWAQKVNWAMAAQRNRQPAREKILSSCAVPQRTTPQACRNGNHTAPGTPGGGADVVVAAIKASDGSVLWSHLFAVH